jgi:large subunit ribosomal protein L29
MKSKLQTKDLRGNDVGELERTLKKIQEDLFQNQLKHKTNQIENTMLLRNARRNIARVRTILNEKARSSQAAGKEK